MVEIIDDKELVISKISTIKLEYVTKRLRDDIDVCTAAFNDYKPSLYYFSKRMQDVFIGSIDTVDQVKTLLDEGFQNHYLLLSYKFNDNKELLKYYYKKYNLIFILKYLSFRLRDDEEFITFIILHSKCQSMYRELRYASERLRSDENFVIILYEKLLLKYGERYCLSDYFMSISKKLLNNRQFILKYAKYAHKYYRWLSDDIKEDKEILLKMISFNYYTVVYTSDELVDDKEVILNVVKYSKIPRKHYPDECMFDVASYRLRSDREFVSNILEIDPRSYEYISRKLKRDRELIKKAMLLDTSVYYFIPHELKQDPYIIWLNNPPEIRKELARKRLIKGVLEELRIRRKMHPEGPFMKRQFESWAEEEVHGRKRHRTETI